MGRQLLECGPDASGPLSTRLPEDAKAVPTGRDRTPKTGGAARFVGRGETGLRGVKALNPRNRKIISNSGPFWARVPLAK